MKLFGFIITTQSRLDREIDQDIDAYSFATRQNAELIYHSNGYREMTDQYPPPHIPLLLMRYGWHLPIEAVSTDRLDPMLNAVGTYWKLKGESNGR